MSISAKFAVIKVGGTTLTGSTGYTLELVADDLDGTTGASGGVVQTEAGCVKGTLRGTVLFDKTLGPSFSAIVAGTAVTNVTAFDDLNGAAVFSVTAGYVMRSMKRAETRTRIEIEIEIACNTFTVA